jgi:hypothetical protein
MTPTQPENFQMIDSRCSELCRPRLARQTKNPADFSWNIALREQRETLLSVVDAQRGNFVEGLEIGRSCLGKLLVLGTLHAWLHRYANRGERLVLSEDIFRDAAIQRCAVARDTPSCIAASLTDKPCTRASCAIGSRFTGLPSRLPLDLALASPALTLS